MSEATVTDSSAKAKGPQPVIPMRLYLTLLWKEFRETGFYAATIMLAGFVLITLGPILFDQYSLLHEYSENKSVFGTLARVFPILLVIASAGASFAIEHENRSYHFLRALPISIQQVFWIKLAALLVLVLSSCLVFWPIAIYLVSRTGNDPSILLSKLPATAFSVGEAFLWALLFSLRDKRVIPAMIKACLGFIFSNSMMIVSQLDINNQAWDNIYFYLVLTFRSTIAIVLVFLIRRSALSWLSDTTAAAGPAEKDRQVIEVDQPKRYASTLRLIWFQWRENSTTFLMLACSNIGIIVATHTAGYGSILSYGYGQLIWVMTIAFLAVFAAKSCGSRKRLLVASGYRPLQIWAIHSLTVLAFCLLTAVLFSWTYHPIDKTIVPKGRSLLGFYVSHCLIGFATGQFISMFFVSTITSCFVAAFALFVSLACYMFSLAAFEQQIPMLISLVLIPLLLVGAFSKRLATEGRLGTRFWFAAPSLFALSLIPLPFLRIYEVPNADVDIMLSAAPAETKGTEKSLPAVRKVGDQLIDLGIRIQKGPSMKYAEVQDLNAKQIEPLIELEASQAMLLNNHENKVRDLQRWERIRSAYSLMQKDLREQIDDGTAEFQQVDQAIKKGLDWHLFLHNHKMLHWWVHHPNTDNGDVRNLIRRLADEQEVFEAYKLFALANHRYSLAAVTTPVNEYPVLAGYRWLPPDWVLLLCPWEVERFKRNVNMRLQRDWSAIKRLTELAQRQDFGYEKALESLGPRVDYHIDKDLISGMLPYFRVGSTRLMTNIIFYRRADRLYLALALWQKEHNGQMPSDLSALVAGGYLKKLPVHPQTGEPFYLAPKGLTAEQLEASQHVEALKTFWQGGTFINRANAERLKSLPGQPFIWMNERGKVDRFSENVVKKITSVEDFVRVTKETSGLSFWILPKPGATQ